MDARARKSSVLQLVVSLAHGPARFDHSKAAPLPKRDERVQQAIAAMKGQLEVRWTVTELARRVGLSRPAFARRFRQSTGSSPIAYLTRLRMERAAELLSVSETGLAAVAAAVGYDSEFAFNRAFKRFHHVAPGTFRRSVARSSAPVFRAAA